MDAVGLGGKVGGVGVAVAHTCRSSHQGEYPRSVALAMSLCCIFFLLSKVCIN